MDGPVAGRHRERHGRAVVKEGLTVVEAAGGDAWCGWGRRKLPEGLDDRSAMQRANLGPSTPLNEARVSTQDVGPALSWIG
jgi:hypothetical protein